MDNIDAAGGGPDRGAVTRLVGAVLAEQHDEWTEGRRFPSLDALTRVRIRPAEPAPPAAPVATPELAATAA